MQGEGNTQPIKYSELKSKDLADIGSSSYNIFFLNKLKKYIYVLILGSMTRRKSVVLKTQQGFHHPVFSKLLPTPNSKGTAAGQANKARAQDIL